MKGDNSRRFDIGDERVAELYASGLDARAVARELNCSQGLVLDRLKKLGIPRRRSASQPMWCDHPECTGNHSTSRTDVKICPAAYERARRTIREWQQSRPGYQKERYQRENGRAPLCVVCGGETIRTTTTDVCKATSRCRRVGGMLWRAKGRARKHGVPFSLKAADVWPFPERCPVLGILLSVEASGVLTDDSPSLDRLNPKLGYVPGNVMVMSVKANRIKNDATPDELRTVARFMKFHTSTRIARRRA